MNAADKRTPTAYWIVLALVLVVFVLVGMGQHRRAADPKTIYQVLLAIDGDCTRVEQALIRAGWIDRLESRAWRIRTSDWFWVNYLADEDRPEP